MGEYFRSTASRQGYEKGVEATIENDTPWEGKLYWVNFDGVEEHAGDVPAGDNILQNTFDGHAFRVYAAGSQNGLLGEFRIQPKDASSPIEMQPIFLLRPCLFDEEIIDEAGPVIKRAAEFERLTHDHLAPCPSDVATSRWSCVRTTSKEQCQRRKALHAGEAPPCNESEPEWCGVAFGFATKHEAQHRDIGETVDEEYVRHISQMPRLTKGPGFLKMNFTEAMRAVIPWYLEKRKVSLSDEGDIEGGYTNNHVHNFDMVNLDYFVPTRNILTREMKDILEWWTNETLIHHATYGIRIYRRHSMLISHVDVEETHLASAVLQIHQETDENGGWPLEVTGENGDCHEVFLQPGELVLYEGGKLRHGRPMRFRGKEFANVFSHFAPQWWRGVRGPRRGRSEL